MIEYLVLGIGVFLVLVSVVYTYSVDRKVNKNTEQIENVSINSLLKETLRENTTEHFSDNSSNYNTAVNNDSLHQGHQLKDSINTIGGELDELIHELREKEQEIKMIVNKARRWNSELSDPIFTKILQEKIAYQEADNFVHRLYTNQASDPRKIESEEVENSNQEVEIISSQEEVVPETESQPVEKIVLNKYEKIKELATKGLSVAEIARQLSMGYREVELVVKMSKKGADTDA